MHVLQINMTEQLPPHFNTDSLLPLNVGAEVYAWIQPCISWDQNVDSSGHAMWEDMNFEVVCASVRKYRNAENHSIREAT